MTFQSHGKSIIPNTNLGGIMVTFTAFRNNLVRNGKSAYKFDDFDFLYNLSLICYTNYGPFINGQGRIVIEVPATGLISLPEWVVGELGKLMNEDRIDIHFTYEASLALDKIIRSFRRHQNATSPGLMEPWEEEDEQEPIWS